MASSTSSSGLSSTRAALLALVLCLAGCRESKFEFAPVAGRVILDGQPVAGAKVVFMPSASGPDGEAGPYSDGETDADGRYRLQTVEESPRSGAVVGRHRVIVSTRKAHLDPTDPDREIIDSPETIPADFTHYRRTPLRVDVPSGGSDAADLTIESSPER